MTGALKESNNINVVTIITGWLQGGDLLYCIVMCHFMNSIKAFLVPVNSTVSSGPTLDTPSPPSAILVTIYNREDLQTINLH